MRTHFAALIVLALSAISANADSLFGAFERSVRNMDRALCERFQSKTCKTYRPQKPVKSSRRVIEKPPKPKLQGKPVVAVAAPVPTIVEKPVLQKRTQSGSACLQNLESAGASFTAIADLTQVNDGGGSCEVATPVRLTRINFAGGAVDLPDQPVLNCAFALQFSDWVAGPAQTIVTSSTRAALGELRTGPGFDCRDRTGDGSSKVSEHASGNAVDVQNIVLTNGLTLDARDALNPDRDAYDVLTQLRKSACESFTTVLGPGSNAAHDAHFHFDLAKRKSGLRICQ